MYRILHIPTGKYVVNFYTAKHNAPLFNNIELAEQFLYGIRNGSYTILNDDCVVLPDFLTSFMPMHRYEFEIIEDV